MIPRMSQYPRAQCLECQGVRVTRCPEGNTHNFRSCEKFIFPPQRGGIFVERGVAQIRTPAGCYICIRQLSKTRAPMRCVILTFAPTNIAPRWGGEDEFLQTF